MHKNHPSCANIWRMQFVPLWSI